MTIPVFKVYATTSQRLPQLPLLDGQLIFVQDTKSVYFDFNGLRLEYAIISTIESEEKRESLSNVAEGFYYVEDTNVLWRYKDGWTQITPSNVDFLYFGGVEAFPKVGKKNVLYVADDATYKWDSTAQEYVVVANKTQWISL